MLHGSDSDAARFRELSGHTFDRLVTDGVVVAYAEAYGGIWNDARLGTRSPARERGLDDVEFLSLLVAHLREEYAVPADRVFMAGFSNGGQMVIRLAAQAPDLFAGAAVISSNHPAPENVLPEMAELDRHQPMPMLTINGTADPIVPFDGGVASLWGSEPRGPVLSSADSAALFAARNGITEPPVSAQVTSGADGDHPHPLASAGSGAGRLLRDRGRRPHGPEPRAERATDPRRHAARPGRRRAGRGVLRARALRRRGADLRRDQASSAARTSSETSKLA